MPRPELNRRRFLMGLGAGAGLALAGCAPRMGAMSSSAATAPQGWGATEAFLQNYIAGKSLPGAMAAIGRGMEAPVYLTAGTQTAADTTRVGPDTIWRVYSMTKPVTGMAAMILIDDGRLTLDQDIGEILPEWANPMVMTDPENSLDARPAAGPITVRHLLTHSAGLGYSIMGPPPLRSAILAAGLSGGVVSRDPRVGMAMSGGSPVAEPPTSIAEFSRRAAELPLIADPGSIWAYSMSLEILSRVIEVAAGMPYAEFLRTRMFAPLGMNDTFFQVPAAKRAQLTDNHVVYEGRTMNVDPAATSIYLDEPPIPFGGGGLASSAHDYDRFLTMLLGYGAIGDARVMSERTARIGMSDLLPAGIDKSRMYAPSGFGAGGAVASAPETGGTEGQPAGSFGWGGAAGTAAWVDFENNMRVSGYIQLMGAENGDFRPGFTRAVYEDLTQ